MCPPHAFPWGKVPNAVRRMRGTPSTTEYIPLNVRAIGITGLYEICGNLFKYRRGGTPGPPAGYVYLQARRRASISSFFFSSTPR